MLPGSPHLMSNVHIEHEGHDTTVEQAAKQYFGGGSAEPKHAALAQYYRSRKMACIVFSVDETLSRRPVVSNDRVADFAESNSDIALAFGSFNPRRGPEAVAEARGLVASGKDSRLEISSALAAIFAQRPGRLSALRSICASPPPGHLSYRTQRDRQRHAGRRRRALEVWQSYAN